MKNLLSRILALLSSNVLAVVLIAVLAAVSLLGTLIPQANIYSSLIFYIILGVLGLSLFACSYNRLLTLLQGGSDLYRWGSFFSHLSVLVIYLGVVYGGAAGFSGYAQIEKGKDYSAPGGLFAMRLNDFNAKFDRSGRPLSYTSDLSVLENGREVLRQTISVNNPLSYKGIKFYQSSYGLTGQLEIIGPGKKVERLPVTKGGCAVFSATGQMFHVAEMFPDLHVLHGMPVEVFEPTLPLVLIENVGWLAQGKSLRAGDYTLKLVSATEYTGLQVKKDPGVWVVYLGFLMLTVGVGMMFYVKR